ncbi:hypothetical protein [Flavivirga jejuensis]|uniref:Uncharacterized protein n=1 Tax=Flavivirga jejuensis TaxID=870487 RepID=A0ABT8WV00_9FLAO|nr:hypothetical protein [Flavivirga jejuensis]MDO5977002.1 hypothetical protein [Flavivirga jejuensis]
MKKKISFALLSLILASNISCKSDDDVSSGITGSLTVEEGKEQLENNSIELLNKIEDFKNDDALNEIIELAEYINGSTTTKSSGFKEIAFNTINNVSSMKTENTDIVLFNAKQSTAIIAENSLVDDFNEETGVYEWNATTEEFDKTGESDDIIYNISYNDKVAVFSFTDFNTTIAGGDDTEELPTLIKANLKINTTTVFSQDFTASFQDDQLIPLSINNITTIGGFVFTTSYSNNNNTSITQSFEFKIGDTVITSYNFTTNGDFNNENANIDDIIDNVAISFQFLDAKLTITATDDNFNTDSELSIDEQIALLNSNIIGELSIDTKSIAKTEFYKDEETQTSYVYNPDTQSGEYVEITEDIINIRFLFEDGTSNDFDTYIEGSFTELEDKFDAVFEAYEDLFEGIEL